MKISPLELAGWVINNYPLINNQPSDLTHLKLQKLVYYCYGISIAYGFDSYFNDFIFEAWGHGPVYRKIYDKYKQYGINIIYRYEDEEYTFHPSIDYFLKQILYIYSPLSPWKIYKQVCSENPWKSTKVGDIIDTKIIKQFFLSQYFLENSKIENPLYVFELSSFKLDNIPIQYYYCFEDVVAAAKRVYYNG